MNTSKNVPGSTRFTETYYVNQHEIDAPKRISSTGSFNQPTADLIADKKSERNWADGSIRIKALGREKSRTYLSKTMPKLRSYDITDADAPAGMDRARFQAEVQASGHKGIGSKVIELTNKLSDESEDNVAEEQQVA